MKPERLEHELAKIPRVALPAGLREEILAKACVARKPSLLTKWWRATPKRLAAAIAAAWVIIAAMEASMPARGRPAPGPGLATSPSSAAPMIAWMQRQQSFLQSL